MVGRVLVGVGHALAAPLIAFFSYMFAQHQPCVFLFLFLPSICLTTRLGGGGPTNDCVAHDGGLCVERPAGARAAQKKIQPPPVAPRSHLFKLRPAVRSGRRRLRQHQRALSGLLCRHPPALLHRRGIRPPWPTVVTWFGTVPDRPHPIPPTLKACPPSWSAHPQWSFPPPPTPFRPPPPPPSCRHSFICPCSACKVRPTTCRTGPSHRSPPSQAPFSTRPQGRWRRQQQHRIRGGHQLARRPPSRWRLG